MHVMPLLMPRLTQARKRGLHCEHQITDSCLHSPQHHSTKQFVHLLLVVVLSHISHLSYAQAAALSSILIVIFLLLSLSASVYDRHPYQSR